MISRVWRGRTAAGNADEYEAFLARTAYPDYGDVEGNRGWILLRQPQGGAVEFMLISFWDSMDALRRYAGPDPERPKYYPEDKAVLLELPDVVDHYDVIDTQVKW